MKSVETLRRAGEIGGRTVQIVETGAVEVATYEPAPLEEGFVRIRTVRSAISPGTEMTFYGRDASNVYLHKRWDPDLRVFEPGEPGLDYPVVFGYRAAGEVIETRFPGVPIGSRIFGNWRHTEFTTLPGASAAGQTVPEPLDWDDAVDLGQMGPICVNAAAHGDGEEVGRPAVVFGAGPIGLITAQVVKAAGADPVYVVDRIPERVAIAGDLGLEGLIAGDTVDVARILKQRHSADGIPVAWECTGSTLALAEAIRVVRRRGRVIAVGFYQGEAKGLALGDEFHHNAVSIVSAQIGNPRPPFDRAALQKRTIELATGGRLALGRLPRLSLVVEEAAAGFLALRRPEDVLQVALTY
ncbi:MAG TPA: zinc-binding dehydrogenase [Candidatus Limnocylindrales bacterium]|nr:zinc-binding dehydrogenase [Candidatus Limnocylindrales bacterium]